MCASQNAPECALEQLKLPKFSEDHAPRPPSSLVRFPDHSSAHVYSAFSMKGLGPNYIYVE